MELFSIRIQRTFQLVSTHICMPVMPVAQRLVIIILFELMRKFFR